MDNQDKSNKENVPYDDANISSNKGNYNYYTWDYQIPSVISNIMFTIPYVLNLTFLNTAGNSILLIIF